MCYIPAGGWLLGTDGVMRYVGPRYPQEVKRTDGFIATDNSRDRIKCYNCYGDVESEFKFCPYCGRVLG